MVGQSDSARGSLGCSVPDIFSAKARNANFRTRRGPELPHGFWFPPGRRVAGRTPSTSCSNRLPETGHRPSGRTGATGAVGVGVAAPQSLSASPLRESPLFVLTSSPGTALVPWNFSSPMEPVASRVASPVSPRESVDTGESSRSCPFTRNREAPKTRGDCRRIWVGSEVEWSSPGPKQTV